MGDTGNDVGSLHIRGITRDTAASFRAEAARHEWSHGEFLDKLLELFLTGNYTVTKAADHE